MSSQHSDNGSGRPLTRREMRELAEKQARDQAASVRAVASTSAPSDPAGSYTGTQNQRSMAASQQHSTNPPRRESTFTGSAAAAPRSVSPQVFPSSGLNSSGSDQSRPYDPRLQSPQVSSTQPESSQVMSSRLEPRSVVAPHQEPVQVTRRSMYTQSPAAGVPNVAPPAQAGAVRILEETGTISRLVDPAAFDPNAQQIHHAPPQTSGPAAQLQPQTDGRSLGNAVPRTNLAGYMRQAPPSSQIPRVEQDTDGNWVASSPAAVQDRAEQHAVLPSWGQNFTGFTEHLNAQPEAGFTPTRANDSGGLPSRTSAFAQSQPATIPEARGDITQLDTAAMPAPVKEPINAAPFSAMAAQPTVPAQVPTRQPSGIAAQAGAPQVGQAVAATPAWDAITSVNSGLPEDPTIAGVSIDNVLTGQVEPVPPTAATSGALFEPISSASSAQGSSAVALPELDLDEEEEVELDHSYTWLHYMILVAVAFVLGMIIWKVALDTATPVKTDQGLGDLLVSVMHRPDHGI